MSAPGPRLSIPTIDSRNERTYTQAEVERFFTEAAEACTEHGVDGYRDLYQLAYLRGRFQVGGAR